MEWQSVQTIVLEDCPCCGVVVDCCAPYPVPRKLLANVFAGPGGVGGCPCLIEESFIIEYTEIPLGAGGFEKFWWGEHICYYGECEIYIRVRLQCGDFTADPGEEGGTPSEDVSCCPEFCAGVADPWAMTVFVTIRPPGCEGFFMSPPDIYICQGGDADCSPFQFPKDIDEEEQEGVCVIGGDAGEPPIICNPCVFITELPDGFEG